MGLDGGAGRADALQALQLGERFFIGAFGQSDAALEAAEGLVAGDEGFAEGRAFGAIGAYGVVFPELSFGAEEAAQDPFVAEEVVNLEALLGSGGLETFEVLVLELGELAAVLAGDELGLGIQAGFQSVHGRYSLALRRTRAGGFLSVEAIGLDLTRSRHSISLAYTIAVGLGRAGFRRAGFVAGAWVDYGEEW